MNEQERTVSHLYFSEHYFGAVWELLDRKSRTTEETERMIHLAHASFLHWCERDDSTDRNRAIGYWQLARVYAAAGVPEQSIEYGERCLSTSVSGGIDPFYAAYAHEAIARAEVIRSRIDDAKRHLDAARALMPTSIEKDLSILDSDLAEIEAML